MISLPVQVEQIAAAIKAMNATDRQRLMTLVPELRTEAASVHHDLDADPWLQDLRAEMTEAKGADVLAWDQTFLGGYTLRQYMALPDEQRGKIWAEAEATFWDEFWHP